MASVALAGIWFNLASDPAQTLYFAYGDGFQVQPTVSMDSVAFAGGNSRATRQPGYSAKWSVNLQAVTPAQRKLLELPPELGGWLGTTVWARDYQGRRVFGFWEVGIAEHRYNTESDVNLSFTTITPPQSWP